MVKFPDGTKVQFIKIAGGSFIWEWTGLAWDANGRPIRRDGSLINNPNTAGIGAGAISYPTSGGHVDMGGMLENYSIWKCTTVTVVRVDGAIASIHQSTVPC